MPNKATLLALALVLAATPWISGQEPAFPGADVPQQAATPAEPEAPPTEAELAIDAAITSVRAMKSVNAEVALDADMLNNAFRVVGQYMKADGNRMLLRLTVEGLPGGTGSRQQVSDGVTFKDYRRILDQQVMTTFQMEPVLKALDSPEGDEEFRRQVTNQLGLAGPESLLVGLRRVAQFDQMAEETLNDRPVRVIRGTWKDREALALPANQNALLQSGFLPSYVPSHITLWLDKETGWPWKLQMEGKVPSTLREERILGPDGRPIGRKSAQTKERPSRMVLTYTLVDKPIDPNEFFFEAPPNVPTQDMTEQIASGLQSTFAAMAQRRRSQDAQQGGLLDQPVTAPRPGDGPLQQPAPAPDPAPPPEQFRSSVPIR